MRISRTLRLLIVSALIWCAFGGWARAQVVPRAPRPPREPGSATGPLAPLSPGGPLSPRAPKEASSPVSPTAESPVTPTASPSGGLPRTGSDPAGFAVSGGALVAAGTVLLFSIRRRRTVVSTESELDEPPLIGW